MFLLCASSSFCETTVLELRRWGCLSTRSPFLQKSVMSYLHRGAFIARRALQNSSRSTSPCLKYSLSESFYFFFILEYILLYPCPFTSFCLPYFPVFKKRLFSLQLQLQVHLKMLFSKRFEQRNVLQSRWLCTHWSVLKQYGALSLNPHRWVIFRFLWMQIALYISDLSSLGHLKERSHLLLPFVSCYLFACIGIDLRDLEFGFWGALYANLFFWLFTCASCWSFLLFMIHHHLFLRTYFKGVGVMCSFPVFLSSGTFFFISGTSFK